MFFSNAKRDACVQCAARHSHGAGIFVVAVLTAACGDGPTTFLAGDVPEFDKPVGMTGITQELRCRVSVADTPSFSCGDAEAGGPDAAAALIVGGQNLFVIVENDAPLAIDDDVLTVPNVRLTNLMALALGTPDRTNVTGIRIFVQNEPTNNVEVLADSTATFLAAGQKYFVYDEFVDPDETTAGQPWQFQMNGADFFDFGVLVHGDDAPLAEIDWVTVGNPNNAAYIGPDSSCQLLTCGSVPYEFRMAKYMVTNARYAEFLNAKGTGDTLLALYHDSMTIDGLNGGIVRTGEHGSYTYTLKRGFANKPVTYVSAFDAMRLANWLHNGRGDGDTETGAYTLLGGTKTPTNGFTVLRNSDARVFLPNENEWYKAAYYDPVTEAYFDYPAGTDAQTTCALPGPTPNTANCGTKLLPGGGGHLLGVSVVGAYTGSPSPYGTFDQGGNLYEWTDQISNFRRIVRGGSWYHVPNTLYGPRTWGSAVPTHQNYTYGFRVAASVE